MAGGEDPAEFEPEFDDKGPKRRGLVWFLFALVVLGVFVVFGQYAYQQGVKQQIPKAPPLLRAETEPFKVAPKEPGGMEVPNLGRSVYNRLDKQDEPPQVEKLLPPPEMPKPDPKAPPPPPPSPAVTTEETSPGTTTVAVIKPAEEGPATPPPASDIPPVPPKPTPEVVTPAPTAPTKAAKATAPAETPKSAAQAEPKPATSAPKPKTAAKPAASAPKPAKSAVPTISASAYLLQLGSYRTASAAETGWKQIRGKHPKVLSGLIHQVTAAKVKDKGVFHRLKVGPFPDRAAASSACAALKARKQGCFIVSPGR